MNTYKAVQHVIGHIKEQIFIMIVMHINTFYSIFFAYFQRNLHNTVIDSVNTFFTICYPRILFLSYFDNKFTMCLDDNVMFNGVHMFCYRCRNS